MKKIFAFFGFVPKSSLVAIETELESLTKSLEEKTTEYEKLFNPELFVPEMTYNEYAVNNERDCKRVGLFNAQLFDEHWEKYMRDHYAACKMRHLCSHPHLFAAFMLEVSRFNWEETCAYMESVNWDWDKKRPLTPTDLIDCVISLLPGFVQTTSERPFMFNPNKPSVISSGGFTVTVGYEDGDHTRPVCKIDFDKNVGLYI